MQNWACCYKGDIVGIVYLQNLMIDCCDVAQKMSRRWIRWGNTMVGFSLYTMADLLNREIKDVDSLWFTKE